MSRIRSLLCMFLLFLAAPVHAQSLIDQITSQLRAQGYSKIEVSQTILGRARIEAKSRDWEREVIVNPRTGEILRDYWEPRSGSTNRGVSGSGLLQTEASKSRNRNRNGRDDGGSSGSSSSSGSSGSGSSGSSSGSSGDDGDDGDDGESDNSGHGSGSDSGGDDGGGDDSGGDDGGDD